MTSTDLKRLFLFCLYHVQASLFFTHMRVHQQATRRIDTLDHNVRFIGPLYINHFQSFFLFFNRLRKRHFAYFTLESIKVITGNHPHRLFFDFTIDPLLQTLNMNDAAKTFTIARRYEHVIFSFFTAKTHFAGWDIPTLTFSFIWHFLFLLHFIYALII